MFIDRQQNATHILHHTVSLLLTHLILNISDHRLIHNSHHSSVVHSTLKTHPFHSVWQITLAIICFRMNARHFALYKPQLHFVRLWLVASRTVLVRWGLLW